MMCSKFHIQVLNIHTQDENVPHTSKCLILMFTNKKKKATVDMTWHMTWGHTVYCMSETKIIYSTVLEMRKLHCSLGCPSCECVSNMPEATVYVSVWLIFLSYKIWPSFVLVVTFRPVLIPRLWPSAFGTAVHGNL